MPRNLIRKALSIALLFSLVTPAFPWSRQGHRLVALVAADYLSPVAAENVRFLLGRDSMADIASFGDDYRSEHPETGPWHYADIPGNEKAYVRERDCPAPTHGGTPDPDPKWRDCAVDRIPYFVEMLRDPQSNKAQRTFALKMLVHLVGDIHQPLHAIGDARGGNSINISAFGTKQCGERYICNLHSMWDDGLIQHRRLSEPKYHALLTQLIADQKFADKPDGTPVAWANASHRAAVGAMVQPGTLIDQSYFDDEIGIVDAELALGGLHLAHLLNGILLTPPPTDEAPGKTKTPGEAPVLKPRPQG